MTQTAVFRGDFEAHLTVRADTDRLLALEAYAAERELKFAHIVLARGRVPQQPMVTVRRSGTLAGVRTEVAEIAARLDADGFPVLRTKIEATPWAEGVPSTDEQAAVLGAHFYFEHHVKLLLAPDSGTTAIEAAARAHAAHLSANTRRVRPDSRLERFVTQRCRGVGDLTATVRLRALLADLTGLDIASIEREFVVYDSNESVDAGWIDEQLL
ncbi:hypothetical protein [Nocardia sp. NPDC052566]|uniref:hypothetical protein n=1 Tax=Nocardia sp. NPDC052566 TaxID=3364330 RepID=UPI0037CB9377